MNDATKKVHELDAKLEAHVARCEERDKTIFNDLAEVKAELKDLRSFITKLGILLISGIASTLATILLGT
tara:strand:- start:1106 stop:1315 length:210 start_codon:yes stop_codon:yes gene_type:complete